uniref:Uncharacterized protein n=1 Tax=Magallana gigas TaxID=29159 RepID=A0A8W8NZI0_MAGGI
MIRNSDVISSKISPGTSKTARQLQYELPEKINTTLHTDEASKVGIKYGGFSVCDGEGERNISRLNNLFCGLHGLVHTWQMLHTKDYTFSKSDGSGCFRLNRSQISKMVTTPLWTLSENRDTTKEDMTQQYLHLSLYLVGACENVLDIM